MIALFGPAGSGKSLQGEILAKKYGWKWISAGQLIRDQHDPVLDAKFKDGELFDDELVNRLVSEAITEAEKNGQEVVLDGWLRNEDQAKWFLEQGGAEKMDGIIILDVPKEELLKRIKLRARPTENVDDKDAIKPIKRRWEIFEQNICSIVPLFEKENVKITTVDGMGTVDEITARIEEVLGDLGVLDELAILGSEEKDGIEKSYGE